MPKRKVGEILWLALRYAIDDRTALIDAYDGDKTELAVKAALSDIRYFKNLQKRLFGDTKSHLEKMMDEMTPRSLFEMLGEDVEVETK